MEYVQNPALPGMQLPFEWKGTPVDDHGRFVNYEFPHHYSLKELLKWKFQRNPQKTAKQSEIWNPPVDHDESFIHSGDDCIVWLGHATFFIRLGGVNILIDPVFYNVPLVKRYVPFPIDPGHLTGLDYVLISHNHLDHCDKRSLQLVAKENRGVTYLSGLKMEGLLSRFTDSEKIQTAGWYQQYHTDDRIRIYYLPARHWTKRGLWDENTQLWGAFVLQAAGKTIYFAADSGYGSHFADAGRIFPEIDYCIIGIGAYKPEWFMSHSHVSPASAVKGANDMHARVVIPMHYGTFDLADEPIGEPIAVLHALDRQGSIQGRLESRKIGEKLPV